MHITIEKFKSIGTIQDYAAKSLIYMEYEPAKYIYILMQGEVHNYRYDVKGNIITLPFRTLHDMLGELPVDGGLIDYQESCECESFCKLLRIDSLKVCELASKDLSVANFLIEKLAKKSRELAQFSCITSASSLAEKVALFIYEHEEHFCASPVNRTASMLNIPPESLSRILRKFRQKNIIDNSNGKYKILEKEALREYFDFAYCGS